jgi:signal transduction histidine kinase
MLAIDLELIAGPHADDDGDETLLTETMARARGISKSVQELSHRLHPETLQVHDLVAALRTLLHESSRPNLTVSFSDRDVPADLSQNVTLCLYRIAQEALSNIVKHSGANRVSMQLFGADEEVVLQIDDDGKGFDPATAGKGRLGLISMIERAEAVGGKLSISSGPGTGTLLQAVIPIVEGSSRRFSDTRMRSDQTSTVT